MSTEIAPELHFISPTPHVPNSAMPVLVYRGAVQGRSEDDIVGLLETNEWKKGEKWKTYDVAHFHSNTHECYTVLKGRSIYSLGKSPIDTDFDEQGQANGMQLEVEKGDVFVLPAGVSHCSIDSEGDYEFIGFYPKDSPKWDMNYCKADPGETAQKAKECRQVDVPGSDPVYGSLGPLPKIWDGAAKMTSN